MALNKAKVKNAIGGTLNLWTCADNITNTTTDIKIQKIEREKISCAMC